MTTPDDSHVTAARWRSALRTALVTAGGGGAALVMPVASGALAPVWLALGAVVVAAAAGAALLLDQTQRPALRVKPAAMPAHQRPEIRGLVAAHADPALLISPAGRIAAHSESARVLFGAALDGKPVSAVARAPELAAAIDQARRTGQAARGEFLSLVPVPRQFEIVAAPVPELSESDQPAAVLITLRDLTAVRRAEELRSDFVANASHELKTPLAALTGFIETLRGPAREDAEARERFLGIMGEQAGRMRRLIDDLLSLNRIELNEHNPPAGAVDIADTIRDVVSALAPIAQADGVTISIETPVDLPRVVGDREELAQVFQNLIDNAIKYGRSGGEIRIRGGHRVEPGKRSAAGGLVWISVEDDGEGIPREVIPRLTERFYRLDARRSRERGGTGLGLAIVKHILNRHNGRLKIESELGRGSVFTVTVPAVAGRRGVRTQGREIPEPGRAVGG